MEFLFLTTQWWYVCDEHFKFLQSSLDTRWKMFTWFYSKFIRETIHQISSKSPKICRRYYTKNILVFFFGHGVYWEENCTELKAGRSTKN